MTTFSLIIKNIINTDNNIFFPTYKINDNVLEIHKLFFNLLLNYNDKITTAIKFHFFINTLQNLFMRNEYRDEFINYFCKIQRIYHLLNSFIANYKYKKAKIVVSQDMCLNEININDKNVFCLLHHNSKYLFHISDLINIINTALTHSQNFFSEPVSIKNPYNNLPFEKSILYNIYIFIKFNTFYRPHFFFNFFQCDFNLTLFANQNEYMLREYIIKNFVYKSTSNILKMEINTMLTQFNIKHKNSKPKYNITIDVAFPNNKLIRIMQPYLLLYCTSNYSLLSHKREEAKNILNKKLIDFYKFNPSFGRKKYKIRVKYINNFKKIISEKIIEYDDKHILFNNVTIQNKIFLADHLKFNECLDVFIRNYPVYDNYSDTSSNNSGEDNWDEEEVIEDEEDEDEQDDEQEDGEDDEDEDEEDDEDENDEEDEEEVEAEAVEAEAVEAEDGEAEAVEAEDGEAEDGEAEDGEAEAQDNNDV
jgi:hypothetical protein